MMSLRWRREARSSFSTRKVGSRALSSCAKEESDNRSRGQPYDNARHRERSNHIHQRTQFAHNPSCIPILPDDATALFIFFRHTLGGRCSYRCQLYQLYRGCQAGRVRACRDAFRTKDGRGSKSSSSSTCRWGAAAQNLKMVVATSGSVQE